MRSKVRAIAANEGRCPISAQCRLLGVARSMYCSMRSRPGRPAAPDPAATAVVAAHAASEGRWRYGEFFSQGGARPWDSRSDVVAHGAQRLV